MSATSSDDVDPVRAAESNFGTMMAINGTFQYVLWPPNSHEILLTGVISGIAVLALALRMYVRLCLVKAFGLDDALMILAWVR